MVLAVTQDRGAWPVGMEPEPGARIINVGIGRYWIGREGIVFNENLVRGTVDVDAVTRGVAAIAELCHGVPAVVLSHASLAGGSTREARAYIDGPEARRTIGAMALVAESPVTRMVLAFFLRVSSMSYPTRVFHSVAEARAWARSQVESIGQRAAAQ
jgi:hypothetical protein